MGTLFPPKGFIGDWYAKFSGQSVLCWCMSYPIHSFSLLVYRKYGSTCLSSVVFWNALPVFWISDADAIKGVYSSRVVFPKDVEAVGDFSPSVGDTTVEIGFFSTVRQYEPLEIYGQHLGSAEGADWKRYRSVANSAFNEVRTNVSDSRSPKQLIPFTSLTTS